MLKIELSRLLKGSFIYGIGSILQRFIGLLMLPFFTEVLTPEDYGVIALISFITVGMTGFFNLGTGNSMGLLYYKENKNEKRHTIIWSNFMLMLVNSLILCSLLTFFSSDISQLIFQSEIYAKYLEIAFLTLVLSTIYEPFLAYLRMEEKAKQYVIMTLSNTVILLSLSILFILYLEWGIYGFFLASLCGNILMLLTVFIFISKKIKFNINSSLFSPLIKIGFPSVWGMFAFLLIDYADRQMIERILGLGELGVYSIGYSFGLIMLVLVGAFSAAWSPFFMSFIDRREEAKEVFGYVLKYYIIGFGFVSVLFFAFAKPISTIMISPNFLNAFLVVGLVAVAYMLKGVYLLMLPGIYFEKKLKLQSMIEWIVAISNICLNLWWIPLFGIVGAASATLVSFALLAILSWYIGKHYLEVTYEWSKIGIVTISYIISAIILYKISIDMSVFLGLSLSIILICFLFLFLYLFIIEKKEKEFILNKIRKKN